MSNNIEFFNAFALVYEQIYGSMDPAETVRQWVLLLESCGVVPIRSLRRSRPPRLLDIGCGPGWHLEPWSEAGFAVSGLDSSPAMIEIAARNQAARPCPLYVADIRSNPPHAELNARFDLAVSHFNFLHLFPSSELAAVFAGVASTLVPGGIWATDVSFPDSLDPVDEVHALSSEGGRARRIGVHDRAAGVYEHYWKVDGSEMIEHYWLYELAGLRSAAEQSSWRWLGCWTWHPEEPMSPWTAETESGERKLLILQRL